MNVVWRSMYFKKKLCYFSKTRINEHISTYVFLCKFSKSMRSEQHHHYCALIVSSDALKAFSLVPLLLYDDSMRERERHSIHVILYTLMKIKTRKRNFSAKSWNRPLCCILWPLSWKIIVFDTGRKKTLTTNPLLLIVHVYILSSLANFLAKMHFPGHKFSKIRLLFDRKTVHRVLMTSSPFWERNRLVWIRKAYLLLKVSHVW